MVRFETEVLDCENYQGNAVVNYTEREVPYTRIIEHKHFEFGSQPKTVISREYPSEWSKGEEPYYPINDAKNSALYAEYAKLAESQKEKCDLLTFMVIRLGDSVYNGVKIIIVY